MANFHLSIKIISRSSGRSSVASAAYRSGSKLSNEYDGLTHDYTNKKGIVHDEIMLPVNAPVEYADRSVLWNAVEMIEKRIDAQTAREIEISLPVELSLDENINLIREYVKKNFVDHGMCADLCVHDKGDGNPHAHIMLSMRSIDANGKWEPKSRKVYTLDENGQKIYDKVKKTYKCTTAKTNDWDNIDNAPKWRENWANICNEALSQAGFDEVIDHRSYEERGIYQIPTEHLGSYVASLEKQNKPTELGDRNRNIIELNIQLTEITNEIDHATAQIINLTSYKERVTELKNNIDEAIKSSSSFDGFLSVMRGKGYLIKQGKHIVFCPPNQNIEHPRYIRAKSLGEQYTEENILLRLSRDNDLDNDPVFIDVNKMINTRPASDVKLLIEIKNNIKYMQSPAYESWTKTENLKRTVATLNYLTHHGIGNYEELQTSIEHQIKSISTVRQSLKSIETKIGNLAEQQKQTEVYVQTRPVYVKYMSQPTKRSKERFYKEHETELILYDTAKTSVAKYKVDGHVKSVSLLRNEIGELNKQKNKIYTDYGKLKEGLNDIYRIKTNIDNLLNHNRHRDKTIELF